MDCTTEEIIAMALAAIVEETLDPAVSLRVISFREVPKSSLEAYIAEHGIAYRKYQLED